jgi:hypothetical protein
MMVYSSAVSMVNQLAEKTVVVKAASSAASSVASRVYSTAA